MGNAIGSCACCSESPLERHICFVYDYFKVIEWLPGRSDVKLHRYERDDEDQDSERSSERNSEKEEG